MRALVDLLPDEAAAQVREALSELQVALREAASGAEAGAAGGPRPKRRPRRTGSRSGAEERPASKLWTPPDRG